MIMKGADNRWVLILNIVHGDESIVEDENVCNVLNYSESERIGGAREPGAEK